MTGQSGRSHPVEQHYWEILPGAAGNGFPVIHATVVTVSGGRCVLLYARVHFTVHHVNNRPPHTAVGAPALLRCSFTYEV